VILLTRNNTKIATRGAQATSDRRTSRPLAVLVPICQHLAAPVKANFDDTLGEKMAQTLATGTPLDYNSSEVKTDASVALRRSHNASPVKPKYDCGSFES
jgi:hypothetical protein